MKESRNLEAGRQGMRKDNRNMQAGKQEYGSRKVGICKWKSWEAGIWKQESRNMEEGKQEYGSGKVGK